MVLLTDGENPIEVEDWEATVHKMNTVQIHLTVVYVTLITSDHEKGSNSRTEVSISMTNIYLFWRKARATSRLVR